MKKLVKFLSVGIACLLLITSFFFIPKNISDTSSADTVSNTYEYSAELDTDYYGMGDFSISNIEQFSFVGGYYLKLDLNVSSAWSYVLSFLSTTSLGSTRRYFDYFIINGVGLNMCLVAPERHLYFETINTTTVDGVVYNNFNCFSDKANISYSVYFSTSYFEVDKNLNVSIVEPEAYTPYISGWESVSDYIPIIDMDSSTNFSFTSYVDSSNSYLFNLLSYCFSSSHGYKEFGSSNFLQSDSSYYSFKLSNVGTLYDYNIFQYRDFIIRNFVDFDFKSIVYSNSFRIYQPAYRVNNTLIFYNFDYFNGLNDTSSVSYVLRKDNSYYNIDYVGSLPNSKYIQLGNSEINNIIFDEYIQLFIDFDSKKIDSSLVSKNSSVIVFNHFLGYDFNFTYYTQPLVSNTSSYNYDFKKPSYKDGSIKLSITPPRLDIPVLAWAENILIFFLFYCPVISDLIELINFDKFFAVLLQIFDIYTSSALGDFVLGCFAFILFWNMLALIMPRFVASAKGWDESPVIDTVSAIKRNSIKKKKEKQLNSRLRTSRNNRVSAFKHSKHDKQYMRSSSFTSFKSKNNINRYERAKHRYLRKK